MPKAESSDSHDTPLVEIGWILVARLGDEARRAVLKARADFRDYLAALYPEFEWRCPILEVGGEGEGADEPVVRLQQAASHRDAQAWDFALVVTDRDLRSYYKSHALGVPSKALGVAVLSTARLRGPGHQIDEARLATRVRALGLHLFGDLNGLWHRDDATAWMVEPGDAEALDSMEEFSEDERNLLRGALVEVADRRLEERPGRSSVCRFYARALWERRREVAEAVFQARPWEFPLRLSRLTTAAVSALFILLLTAEVWDLASSQGLPGIAALSVSCLTMTTLFVLTRQKLFPRLSRRRTEQAAVAHASVVITVSLGLLTTYALLATLVLLAGAALFDSPLLARWAPAGGADSQHLIAVAGFVAAVGIVIGALGASLEANHYFQHIIYADEET